MESAPRTHQDMGNSQSAHFRLQGQSRRAPVGSLWTSGPQVIHQQTGVAVRPHPWGVRGPAQAWMQAVGLGNPDWVLWCLLWSLLGTQIHMGTHTHTHTQTYVYSQRKVPCADLDPPLPLRAQTGTEDQSGGQAPGATISQPRNPCCPSEETPAPHPSTTKRFDRKQTSTTQLRSRAAPGAMQAARGRESVARDHSMAELVPVQQQGLDLGRAHPQPLLQQLPPGCVLPGPVCDVDCQGTVPVAA